MGASAAIISAVITVIGTIVVGLLVRNTTTNVASAQTLATENSTVLKGFTDLTTRLDVDVARIKEERDEALLQRDAARQQTEELWTLVTDLQAEIRRLKRPRK